MKSVIFPKTLKKGDKIAIISPAGSVVSEQLKSTLSLIKSEGYDPILGKHLYGKYTQGYSYSGTEQERIRDLNWALNDNDISAIWASRGGYGCQHLLEHLKLNGFKKNPKWYIGYSDNTVIHSCLLKKGYASINGQTIKTSSFGVIDEGYKMIFDILKGTLPNILVDKNEFNKQGTIGGQLVGGNLALIYALLGTKYSFDFKDKILFIEEIGEDYYALDRMLMSLELAGVFKKINALIIGGMTNMGKEETNQEYEKSFDTFAYQIISERIKNYDFPVAFGFPNGHIFENKPLVIGAKINLSIGEKVEVYYA